MLVLNASHSRYMILFENDELKKSDISPDNADIEKLVEKVRGLLPGIVNDDMGFEFYPGDRQSLLFVTARAKGRLFFEFASFDDLLCALHYCRDLPSRLISIDEKYILAVSYWDKDDIAPSFYDYCTSCTADYGYELYLSEHGRVLLGSGAVTYLRSTFHVM